MALPLAQISASWTPLLTALGVGFIMLTAWGFTLLAMRLLDKAITGESRRLVDQLKWPTFLGLLVFLGSLALEASGLVPARFAPWVAPTRAIIVILVAAYVLSRILVVLVQAYGERHGARGTQTAFTRYLVHAAIYGLALVLVLNELGLAITPLVTALGVGGIAVALALQETLSNLFAGLYLVIDGSIQLGDWIEMEDGRSGYVEEMTWRTVRIRTVADNTHLIPNHLVATRPLKNAGLPDREIGVTIQVSVALESDLEQVEAIARDVAAWVQREVGKGPEGYVPTVRFDGVGPVGISFTTILRADESFEHHELTHAYIKELHRRFHEEGVELAVHPDMEMETGPTS
ncbi:MAG: mechanosensitive ion channel family protein [Candidatus Thermoplasmatota archaeon]|nr:mechanosensitive ion channel family protein [Candidatus Thermoplasmatota archaeon]